MSKTIIGVVVGIVVVLGGYFLISSSNKVDKDISANSNKEENSKESSGKKMAFSEFMKEGGAYKCTVNQNVNNMETVGTTYMSDGMIRGEFNTKVQGMDVSSTLIVRDGYTYTWTSMLPNMGFKAKVAEGVSGSSGTSGQYSFNAEQIGDYDCEQWSVDHTKFTLPFGVTFKEIN